MDAICRTSLPSIPSKVPPTSLIGNVRGGSGSGEAANAVHDTPVNRLMYVCPAAAIGSDATTSTIVGPMDFSWDMPKPAKVLSTDGPSLSSCSSSRLKNIGHDDDDGHEDGGCPLMLRALAEWQKRLPTDPNDPDSESWLSIQRINGQWIAGCTLCNKFSDDPKHNAFACFKKSETTQLCHFKAHAASVTHQRALVRMKGGQSKTRAPSQDNFEAVLRHCLQGASLNSCIDGVGCRKKLQRIIWCLAEARRQQRRYFLAQSPLVVVVPPAELGSVSS
jgi:hypothetical protein